MKNQRPSPPKRRSTRLPNYDYRSSGAYYVTICTAAKRPLFGTVRDGEVNLNYLGQIASNCWRRIEGIRSEVELDEFIVMPNHIHGILIMSSEAEMTKDPVPEYGLAAGSLGAIVAQYKSTVTKRGQTLDPPAPRQIWQRSFYDHIIRSASSLDKIRRYIIENPARWENDAFYID